MRVFCFWIDYWYSCIFKIETEIVKSIGKSMLLRRDVDYIIISLTFIWGTSWIKTVIWTLILVVFLLMMCTEDLKLLSFYFCYLCFVGFIIIEWFSNPFYKKILFFRFHIAVIPSWLRLRLVYRWVPCNYLLIKINVI